MKNCVLISLLIIMCAGQTIAEPYSVIKKVFTNGSCQNYYVDIYDDRGTTDPTDDVLISSGVVTNCTSEEVNNNPEFYQDMTAFASKESITEELIIEQVSEPDDYMLPVEDLSINYISSDNKIVVDLKGFDPVHGLVQHQNGPIASQFSMTEAGEKYTIDTSDLAPGNYVVTMYDGKILREAHVVIE